MPCTYDFEVTGSKYLHAVRDGFIPLILLFSGTIFTRGSSGFGVEQVGWDCEAAYQLPASVWQQVIELNFPGTGWLRLDRDVLRALARYQAEHGLTTWDATVESLLAAAPPAACRERAHREPRGRPDRGRRGAVRGLSALSVPGDVGEEPAALAVRGARTTGRRRGRTRRGPAAGHPVPTARARRRGGARGHGAPALPAVAAAQRRRMGRSHRARSEPADTSAGRTLDDGDRPRDDRRLHQWPGGPLAARGRGESRRDAARGLPAPVGRGAEPRTRTRTNQGRSVAGVTDRSACAPGGDRPGVRLVARPAQPGPSGGRGVPAAPVLAGARRSGRDDRHRSGLADHPLRPPRGGPGKRRRAVRLDRNRRDLDPAGADHDRRGEGAGEGHRPAGQADHRPQREPDARGPAAAARNPAEPARRESTAVGVRSSTSRGGIRLSTSRCSRRWTRSKSVGSA